MSKDRQATATTFGQTWRFVAGLAAAATSALAVLVAGANGAALMLGKEDAAAAGVCLGSCGMH